MFSLSHAMQFYYRHFFLQFCYSYLHPHIKTNRITKTFVKIASYPPSLLSLPPSPSLFPTLPTHSPLSLLPSLSSGDAASDHDSESENNSVQSPTNTIPPETPALSPFLTGRKGPLPNSDARSRFSPKGGRSDKKSSDFLSLDNYLEK